MDYMFDSGYLGSRAPFFMDILISIVTILPFLLLFGIYLAKKGYMKLHIYYQISIFIISFIILGWFEYGVRVGGGFKEFVKSASYSQEFIVLYLVIHIMISTISTIYWGYILIKTYINYLNDTLNSEKIIKHKKEGKVALLGVILSSITGIWIYILLF